MERKDAVKILMKKGELPTPEKISKILSPKKEPEVASRKADNTESVVKIIKSYKAEPKKLNISDFTDLFRGRYTTLKNMLMHRAETENTTSISKLAGYGNEKVTIIAMVKDIIKLPTESLKIELEDLTGVISAIISPKNEEIYEKAREIGLDEVIALKGSASRKIFFIDEIIWPDIPIKTFEKCKDEVYVAITSDLHVGSNTFLPEKLENFIQWLNGKYGTPKEKEIAAKTKYILMPGDIVDGIGIYPNQDKELNITDICKQYEEAARFINRIPQDKKVVICPGNHDSMRLSEPQLPLPKEFASPLYENDNVIHVSNPAYINIHNVNGYKGVNVLMYHGFSFDYFLDKNEVLRTSGGYERPDLLMKYLLKRRHLAPSYGATLAMPGKEDALMITQTPDLFITGHIHKSYIAKYNGVYTITGSTWQKNTSFQDRVGLVAEPGRVALLNLKTGATSFMKFAEEYC